VLARTNLTGKQHGMFAAGSSQWPVRSAVSLAMCVTIDIAKGEAPL